MGKSYVLYSSVGSSADVDNDISFDQAIIPRSSGDPVKIQKEYEIFSDFSVFGYSKFWSHKFFMEYQCCVEV